MGNGVRHNGLTLPGKASEHFMCNQISSRAAFRVAVLLCPLLATVNFARAQSLTVKDLIGALRTGGYVILMRHASSPRDPPDGVQAEVDNLQQERQLDEDGRISARAMGEALRRLGIPIGRVLSSPTYRALETVKLAKLGPASTFVELGDGGQSMLADKSGARAAWLKEASAVPPMPRQNTIIVTHFPNITEAFPRDAAGLADGEALILHPDGKGTTQVIARVKINEWSDLIGSP